MRKLDSRRGVAGIASRPCAVARRATIRYLWLEDIDGPRALRAGQGVERGDRGAGRQGARVTSNIGKRALAILDDEQQIAEPEEVLGDQVTNLWRDATEPARAVAHRLALVLRRRQAAVADADRRRCARQGRGQELGVARRQLPCARLSRAASSRSAPAAPTPTWCASSTSRRASSSPAASRLPDAKTNTTWVDADHLLVATDFGAGQPDHFGLCADRQAVDARHAAGVGKDRVHGARRGRQRVSPSPTSTATSAGSLSTARKTTWTNGHSAGDRDGTAGADCRCPTPPSVNDVVAGPADRDAQRAARQHSRPERWSPGRWLTLPPAARPRRSS